MEGWIKIRVMILDAAMIGPGRLASIIQRFHAFHMDGVAEPFPRFH